MNDKTVTPSILVATAVPKKQLPALKLPLPINATRCIDACLNQYMETSHGQAKKDRG
jgi:hypothetical protein